MKNLIIGIIIGMLLGGGIVYASSRATLVNGDGTEMGVSGSPLIVSMT